jgi:uncharacterized repeat protein (TIGR03803 family)
MFKTFTLAVLAIMAGVASPVWAGTEKVLYSFAGGPDGNGPFSGLVADKAGNVYGTTQNGGTTNNGTVFELSPSSGGGWTEKILYSFCTQPPNCADGYGPTGGLIFDESGNLYGTTSFGGNEACQPGCGTVFELSPNSDGTWTETVLHSFSGTDGANPSNSFLIFDKTGNIYGTTQGGGAYGHGAVFELSGSGGWSETVLYSFCAVSNCSDGQIPLAGAIFDKSGNLYGETYAGGTYNDGTIFKLSPRSGGWSERVLHSFGGFDGLGPQGGLVFDKKGGLYGSTSSGGAHGSGEVFKLTRSKKGWNRTVLHTFKGADGQFPYDHLIFDKAGNLFGTTAGGGKCDNCGTVFELKPLWRGWKETAVYGFTGGGGDGDGFDPLGSLLLGKSGRLYGTTATGGTGGFGTVFEVTR